MTASTDSQTQRVPPRRRPHALTAVVTDDLSEPTALSLYGNSRAVASVALTPAGCIALATELLSAARRRLDRPVGGPLPDPVQERYAQFRAAGRTQLQAY